MCGLFTPEIIWAGAVKGLSFCRYIDSLFCFRERERERERGTKKSIKETGPLGKGALFYGFKQRKISVMVVALSHCLCIRETGVAIP